MAHHDYMGVFAVGKRFPSAHISAKGEGGDAMGDLVKLTRITTLECSDVIRVIEVGEAKGWSAERILFLVKAEAREAVHAAEEADLAEECKEQVGKRGPLAGYNKPLQRRISSFAAMVGEEPVSLTRYRLAKEKRQEEASGGDYPPEAA